MPFRTLLSRDCCSDAKWSPLLSIGLVTFGILVLELAIIRWTSSQVRIFAYFNNIVLLCAFFGMGTGVALGKRFPGLAHLALPALLLLSLPLAFSEKLGIVSMVFPDNSIVLWGGEIIKMDPVIFVRNLGIFLSLCLGIIFCFAALGAPLGVLFGRARVLGAYGADLCGSLLGVAAFTLAACFNAGPAIWLLLGCLPFLVLLRSRLALLCTVGIVALAQYSVQGALFSPYNRITVTQDRSSYFEELRVNRDFHQYLHNLSDKRLSEPGIPDKDRETLQDFRQLYDLPFTLNQQRGSALIVGGGTGNDVQAALRNGYAKVTSVDIDGLIISLGRQRHPEKPYSHPGVTAVVDDARAYFGKDRGDTYDIVCYGLLDSHAMSSAMSTLRLDNYVYTEEGIRDAWKRVSEHGHLSLALSCIAGQWFFERLYWTITKATGKEPIAIFTPMHAAVTFIVPRDGVTLSPQVLGPRIKVHPLSDSKHVLSTSDDWPFLYLRPGAFPWGYAAVLGFLLTLALVVVKPVFGLGKPGTSFDWPLFLMGAAFMLLETRGVTSMSLLFGSTWVVNSAIFGGILLMVLLANTLVLRRRLQNPLPWFPLLFVAVFLLWLLPVAWLQGLPLLGRGLLAGLITGLPVGLAGLIVPILLSRSSNAAASLGSNLLGAVLGGCLEYLSLFAGLRSTALMALVLYLLAYALLRRRAESPQTP